MSKKWLNKKFHKLTVIEDLGMEKRNTTKIRLCKLVCDCGSDPIIRNVYAVRSGGIQSCGCLPRGGSYKHGDSHANSYYYRTWCSIKRRCYNKNYWQDSWRKRGIIMCDEWLHDYIAFKKYILDTIGEQPHSKMTLDRIDNDKNYEPGNLKWSTRKEQSLNRTPREYSKITREDAHDIRVRKSNGEKAKDLAKEYDINWKYIYTIINNKVWIDETIKINNK